MSTHVTTQDNENANDEKREAIPVTSAHELMQSLGGDEPIVHEREVCGRVFYIKEISAGDALAAMLRPLRTSNNEIVRSPLSEARFGFMWTVHLACVKGPTGADARALLFTLEEAEQLIDHPQGASLCGNLTKAIHGVNPELSPKKK